ncbi:MAG: hypothetical protein JW985_03340 [Alphaproteobacteria bacterium]|jgi:hypothetical protein|nr:hypothetical protein [Alphaproteobacteria bacterium]
MPCISQKNKTKILIASPSKRKPDLSKEVSEFVKSLEFAKKRLEEEISKKYPDGKIINKLQEIITNIEQSVGHSK